MSASKRFIKVREYLGLERSEFAEKLGFKPYKIKDIEIEKQKVTPEIAEYLEKNFSISGWWLLTGKGQMLNSSTSNSKNGYEIDVLNVKASAGAGIENHIVEVIDTVILDKTLFKTAPDVSRIKLIQVSGDSMQPTLNDGDFVIIDETKTHGIDGVYAIQLHGQILIKRLKFKLDGTIEIISDNKEYSPEIFEPQNTQVPFHIIGMKTLSIQR